MRPKVNSNYFGVFLELISRFEFEFRRCGIFLEGFEFFVFQSSTTSNVAVHVPVLWPVCAHTITFRMLWCLLRFTITLKTIYIYIHLYIYQKCSKKHENIVEGRANRS